MFRTDSSRRVLAISGRVTTEEGTRRRRRFVTFVIHSSALTSLALGEKRGATIEWEKWKGKVTTVDRSSRLPYVEVEGSQVFILGKRVSQETGTDFTCTVHDFSPGARKEQGNPPYISQQLTLTTTRLSTWWPQRSWEVSGNTVVLLDVRDLNCVRAYLVLRFIPGTSGSPGNRGALHRHFLVYLNLNPPTRVVFGSSQVSRILIVVSKYLRCITFPATSDCHRKSGETSIICSDEHSPSEPSPHPEIIGEGTR